MPRTTSGSNTMPAMSETPAGWYDDPGNPGIARFWDGAAWTEARRPVPQPQQESVTDGVFNGLVAFVCFAVLIVAVLVALYYVSGG
jgi:hypothetical protein